MKIDIIVGIDPGANGGIAVYRPGYKTTCIRMPKDINDIREYLNYIKGLGTPIVFLEKLSIRPDDVSVEGGGVNMGKMYRIQGMIAGYEQLKATISFCGIPYVMVHPMKWQNDLKLRINRKGFKEEKAARKRRYRDIAAKQYPEIKATLWSADATLIMHFGRYIIQNNPNWVMENLPKGVTDKLF